MCNDTYDNKSFAPKPVHKNEELSPEEDLDEWLKAEMEKRMSGHDKESEEDTLIDILKSLVGECKVVHTNKSTRIEASSHGTNEVQGVSFVTEKQGDISEALPCQLPPKTQGVSLFLAQLETNMVVEMADMTKKAPLGIVENILVKISKFLFLFDFIIIVMLGEPNETMILGRPFLATIHAQIDVFKREISLGIGEDRVKFDMDGGISHSRIPVEKLYMASSVYEEEYFNPHEIKDDVFSYESPACLLFEQHTQSYDNESVDILDSAGDIQELEGNHEDEVMDSFDVEVDYGKHKTTHIQEGLMNTRKSLTMKLDSWQTNMIKNRKERDADVC
ncbi:phospholipase-like protein [Tanacetum coccineum]